MRLTTPFAFISYNTTPFLQDKLEIYEQNKIINRAYSVYHETTGTEKNHSHVYIEPRRQIDTDSLKSDFVEVIDEQPQSIALKPRPRSKFTDFYLYAIHDSDYLKFKGLLREHVNIAENHIVIGDFKDDIYQAEYYRDRVCLAPINRLIVLAERGYSLIDVYEELRIPYSQFSAVKKAYNLICVEIKAYKTLYEYAERTDEQSPFKR